MSPERESPSKTFITPIGPLLIYYIDITDFLIFIYCINKLDIALPLKN